MSSKRNGSGGMVRRHPSRDLWEARYVGADGRKHSLYATSRSEAQERLRAAQTAASHGIRAVGQRLTVGTYLEDWLATSVAARCRPRTIDSYRGTVQRYIIPALGRIGLAKLEPRQVERMLATLTSRGTLSPTTVRYANVVLRNALGRALKAGLVARNVATLVDPPSRSRTEMHPLTAAQARQFLESTASDRFGPIYAVAITTGLRQGEILGLRWADVDLDRGWLSVRNTLRQGTTELAEPKTDRARRTLRLGPGILATLRGHRAAQLQQRLAAGPLWQDRDFVFATRHGTPFDARNVGRAFQEALKRAGLPRQRFHDLRHAYATLMLEDGEELAVISRTLGHGDLSTTADIYGHLTPAMLDRTAARMDVILGPRGEVATR